VPVIGITKLEGLSEEERLNQAYITPSFKDAARVAGSGADIIALDATQRVRVAEPSLNEPVLQNGLQRL
jgi:putative N-acetylmannosamine-6-phosphate epimerase